MISKTNATATRVVSLAVLTAAFFFAACNNGSENKDKPADTPAVKAPETPVMDTPAATIDTNNMKEATPRPVKTSD